MTFWRRERSWSDDEWRMHSFFLKVGCFVLGAVAFIALLSLLIVRLVF